MPGVLRSDPARGAERGERIVAVPGPKLHARQLDEVAGATLGEHWLCLDGLLYYVETDDLRVMRMSGVMTVPGDIWEAACTRSPIYCATGRHP